MMGFGPVAPEPDEPVFHADWEKRALALTLAAGALGEWNIDKSRHARERLPPGEYLTSSYYAIWSKGLEALLLQAGLVTLEEVRAGRALGRGPATRGARLEAARVAEVLAKGAPYDRAPPTTAVFAAGDRVRAKVINPASHTRLPRYVRGRSGLVIDVRGVFVFPDSNARGLGEDPQWLYGVAFTGPELWGPEADPTLEVVLDCWEPYLEAAP